jgi:uncharacterized protein YraI
MLKYILAASLILSSAIALPAHAEDSSTHYVCTNNRDSSLTLRRGPGKGYKQVRQIPTGNGIRQIDSRTTGDGFTWYKIAYKGSIGWVRSDYVCNYEGGPG